MTKSSLPDAPGDIEAFVKRYEASIYRYVLRLVGSSDAEDLTQDVFLKAIAGLPRFRGEVSVETWLFRIATNTCRDYWRRKRWQTLLFLRTPDDEDDPLDRVAAKDDPLERSAIRTLVRASLRELPPRQREVVILRDIEGFSYDEIASIVGCPVGTVKSRLYHARARLAKKLESMGLKRNSFQEGGR